MPRTISGARPAPARVKAAFTAILAVAALALSACESSGLGSIGGWFGGEGSGKAESPAATRTEASNTGSSGTGSSGTGSSGTGSSGTGSSGTGSSGTGSSGTGASGGGASSETVNETVDTPSGEPGRVVEIISSDEAPAATPTPPGQASNATQQPPESMAAIPPEPAINDDPEQLIGMGPASLNAFLGAPQLIRREAPASLWQYRADGCVLDVVLYPDRTGDKVTYLEAREDGATKIPPRDCLNKLLRARFDGSSG